MGDLRPVGPEQGEDVRHADDRPRNAPGEVHPRAEPVHGYDAVATELPSEPFGNQHLLRHAGFVKLHSGAFELPHRLDEIAGIGPETRMVEGHDEVAGLPGEAAQPLHLLPALGLIFAAVGVAARDQHGVPVLGSHELAQPFDSLPVDIFHITQR